MYRLCNPINPTIKYEASTIDALFDFRTNGFANLQYSGRATPRHWKEWLAATIDDSNWEDYLKIRILHHYSVNPDDHPKYHYYQLFKLLLKDRPKWLMEYIHISLNDTGAQLRYNTPMMDERPDSTIRFNENSASLPYTGSPANIWNDHDYYNGDVSFDPAQQLNADTIMDALQQSFITFFAESGNRNAEQDWDYLARNNLHNNFVKRSLQYLQDKSVICFQRQGRDVENIRVSTATTRYTDLPVDLCSRASVTCYFEGGSVIILYKEPRAPASRTQLATILNYTSNVLDYLPFNIRGNREEKAPLYGVELEACSNYTPAQIIGAQQELFFIMKQDGSISGDGAYKYEMVTVPATLKAHKRLWAEFFNKVDYTQFDTSKSTGNGMHVHIDRKAFGVKGHLNRFTWFFINPANFEFLFEISERPSKNDMMRWAPLPAFTERQTKAQVMSDAVRKNHGIRGTVHIKGQTTVEIRMFKGVVSFATIVKNLEFVDSVMQFTAETSLINVTLPKYLAWLAAQPKNRYQLIREFISQFKAIDQVLLANELKDFLFSSIKPESILAKLQKAKFTITNKHLTILNREKRKRTFVMGKDGTVQLAYSNSGKLSSLDKSLQAKMTRGSTSIAISLI